MAEGRCSQGKEPAEAMISLVALGEPLIQLNAVTPGPLRYVTYFEKHVAGSEANFCIAATMAGARCSLIARVGDDEFGRNIVEYLRGRGVDVSHVKVDPGAPTGIYFVQRHFPVPGRSRLIYYRRGSAGSRVGPDDVDSSLISSADAVHSTGITLALSDSANRAVHKAFGEAKRRTFDTNIRPALWPDLAAARRAILDVLNYGVDVLVTDPDDTQILLGVRDPEEAYRKYRELGVQTLVYKLGAEGAYVFWNGGSYFRGALKVAVEDPTGAGDAVAGYFVALYLSGVDPRRALDLAVAASALVVGVRGDNEALPSPREAEELLKAL